MMNENNKDTPSSLEEFMDMISEFEEVGELRMCMTKNLGSYFYSVHISPYGRGNFETFLETGSTLLDALEQALKTLSRKFPAKEL